jgi:hypothetical protein
MFKIARKIHKRRNDYKGPALAEDLQELVTRDPGRSIPYEERSVHVGGDEDQAPGEGQEAPHRPQPSHLLLRQEKLHAGPESEP